MSLPLQIFHAIAPNKLVAGANSAASYALPDLVEGGSLVLNYQALLGLAARFTVANVAEYAGPQVGVFSLTGTQLAFQNTFVPDGVNNIYVGTLSLSDAAFTSEVSVLNNLGETSAGVNVYGYLSIKMTDLDGLPVHLPPQRVRLWKNPFTATAVTVPPADTALTMAIGNNLFLKRESDGTPRIEASQSGATRWLIWRDDNGVEQKQLLA